MDFQHSERSLALQDRVRQFMKRHVEPVEDLYYEQVKPEAERYRTPPVLQDLKRLAREEGLWNLALAAPQSKWSEAEPMLHQIAKTVQFPD